MAWDTEQTRQRLRDAAVVEFAEHGFGAARVDRIAARAGVNKERIYGYFGDKQGLFADVLEGELAKVAEAVPLTVKSTEDLGELAGRIFDYYAEHPHLARLLHWEALESGDVPLEKDHVRASRYREKVAQLSAAQRARNVVGEIDADYLLFFVLALASWWFAVPQLVRLITRRAPDSRSERAKQRAAVVKAARRLGGPR